MIGYKAFDENLMCRGFQFEVGKTYKTEAKKDELKLCTDTVFHFCRELHRIEAVSDYTISNSRVCEVIAEGDIVTDGDKYGTNKITILREIPKEELKKYNNCNSGNCNSAGAEVSEGEFEKSLLEKGVCLQSDLDEAKEIIAMQKRALENYILSPDETIKDLIRKAEALLKV